MGLSQRWIFYTYPDARELISQTERVLDNWPAHAAPAERKLVIFSELYSKEWRWWGLQDLVERL